MKKKVDINVKLGILRDELRISAKRMAEKTGYSLNSVIRYEKEIDPPFKYLAALVDVFRVRPSYFFDPEDDVIFKQDEKADPELAEIVSQHGKQLEDLANAMSALQNDYRIMVAELKNDYGKKGEKNNDD